MLTNTLFSWPIEITVFNIIGFMGALALIYSVLLEAEKHQDAVIVVASASLFVYALFIGNKLFMFATAGIFLVAGRELIQIFRGKHIHSRETIQQCLDPNHKDIKKP